MFANRQMTGGLVMFGFQFFIQSGVFFTIPLFLSVVLELNALQTGVRLLPLSLALLVSAMAVPRLRPTASPRRVVRLGLLSMLVGTMLLVGGTRPRSRRRHRARADGPDGPGHRRPRLPTGGRHRVRAARRR